MASDRMMEYYYSMAQDSLGNNDLEEAVSYFRKAANLGAKEAAREIGVIGHRYETGKNAEKDEEKAVRCYQIAGDYGEDEAWYYLGMLYFRGINGAKPNPRKAKRTLEKAADAGVLDAILMLAKVYDEGLLGYVNYALSFKYYLKAAEYGNSDAMLMTGLFYAQGDVVPKNLDEAEKWIRRGCELGHPDGENTLRGFLSVACIEYAAGAAGRVDDKKAFEFAEEVEKMGEDDIFLRLGKYYKNSRQSNHAENAFRAFKKAAERGIPEAQSALGLCYEAAVGTEENIQEAVGLYKKAALAGDPFGMAHYGYALANGEGVKVNEKEAMEWLIKAAMKGDKGAVQILADDYNYIFDKKV